MGVLIFTTTFVWNTILRIIQRDIIIVIIMCICFPAKYPLLLLDLMKIEFSLQILKNTQIRNFMKILPVEAELFHEEEQTADRT